MNGNKYMVSDEEMRSFDVSALFTSVPVDKALQVSQKRLNEDVTLCFRTNMSPRDVIRFLELCMKCTYFMFDGSFYQQIHRAAMYSPVSPHSVQSIHGGFRSEGPVNGSSFSRLVVSLCR